MPDIHFPFHCKNSLKKCLDLIRKIKPHYVIQLGDILDQYVFSKYPRNLSITPKDDIEKGIDFMENFWDEVKIKSPKSKRIQLLGNHCVRVTKRVQERLPELLEFFDHRYFYKLNDVKVMGSDKDHFELEGIVFTHGFLSKSIDHAKNHFLKPVVHGHLHRPSITFENKDLWSMDCGYLADHTQLPLQYGQSRIVKWTKACGLVDGKEPRLFILE